MTREEHINLSYKFREKAAKAIHNLCETQDKKYLDEHIEYMKLANKHYGIANMMFTKKYGKIDRRETKP